MPRQKKIDYASLFTLRSDGRYQGYYKDADGKRRAVCDRDPEALFRKLQERQEAADAGEAPPVPTFREVAEKWEREHREEIEDRTWSFCGRVLTPCFWPGQFRRGLFWCLQ